MIYWYPYILNLSQFHSKAKLSLQNCRHGWQRSRACFAPGQSAGHFRRPKLARHGTLWKGAMQTLSTWEWAAASIKSGQINSAENQKRNGFLSSSSGQLSHLTLRRARLNAHGDDRTKLGPFQSQASIQILSSITEALLAICNLHSCSSTCWNSVVLLFPTIRSSRAMLGRTCTVSSTKFRRQHFNSCRF